MTEGPLEYVKRATMPHPAPRVIGFIRFLAIGVFDIDDVPSLVETSLGAALVSRCTHKH